MRLGAQLAADDGGPVDDRHHRVGAGAGRSGTGEHADEVADLDLEADLLPGLPHDGVPGMLVGLHPAADQPPAAVVRPFHQQDPALVVDQRGVGADLRRDAAGLFGEASHQHRVVDRADLGVGLPRQVDQALVALPVEGVLGEVQPCPTDGLDRLGQGHDVGQQAGGGQAGRLPSLETAVDVGGRGAAQVEGRGRHEAGLVALVAEDDQGSFRRAELGVAPLGARVEAPLHHVALDHDRTRHLSVPPPLLHRADVHQQRTVVDRGLGLEGRRSVAQPRPGGGQQLVDSAGHFASLSCETLPVDLTAVATPGYFATMGLENQLLKRRAERTGPTAADYEKDDTLANLAMGVASLLVPLVTYPLAERIAPQRSKVGKGLIALAAGAAVATTVADRVARRRRWRTVDRVASSNGHTPSPDPVLDRAELVARYGGPTAIAAGGVALTTAALTATRPKKLWASPRRTRDLGTGVLAAVATIAAWDFIYYWNHRLMHTSRVLWAHHVAHHSSERFNLSTALRQPVADVLGVYLPYGVLCFAGIRPSLIEQARAINLLYQYWIHTDLIPKLGPFEEPFNTASHHRVHHGSNRRYIDRNHGSILIVWDRLFGTFAREDDAEPVVYGLTKNIRSNSPVTIATHEFRDILGDVADSDNWRDRLSFVFRGPGWAYRRRDELDGTHLAPVPEPEPAVA